MTAYILTLPCLKCPATLVHADSLERAAAILFGNTVKPMAKGCRFVNVSGKRLEEARQQIRDAGTGRWTCRCEAST